MPQIYKYLGYEFANICMSDLQYLENLSIDRLSALMSCLCTLHVFHAVT